MDSFLTWRLVLYSLLLCVGNIANVLKLSEVDSIYLPIPVNFIFIGFEGKGNHGMQLLSFFMLSMYKYTNMFMVQ